MYIYIITLYTSSSVFRAFIPEVPTLWGALPLRHYPFIKNDPMKICNFSLLFADVHETFLSLYTPYWRSTFLQTSLDVTHFQQCHFLVAGADSNGNEGL